MSDLMTPDQKAWIDGAAYESLLSKWRFHPAGDPMFTGETGKYYGEVLAQRRTALGPAVHTAASKTSRNETTSKKALVLWVSDFLWHWESASMTGDKAAEIIVSNILACQQAEDQNGQHRLPEPQSFFGSQE